MSPLTKFTLSGLPLPPISYILPHNLTPDPHTEDPSTFRKVVLQERPSIQRRARLLAPPSHFSYVSPLPIAFPYQVSPEEGHVVKDQQSFIEYWLSQRESGQVKHEPSPSPLPNSSHLTILYPKEGSRDQELKLVGLSETGLRDCLPHLRVGDAFESLGSPTLSKANEEETARPDPSQEDLAARQELVDVLSGHAALMSAEGDAVQWAPWSLRYSGHQFGNWAGQLGDGRAISILATPHPEKPGEVIELQLKGAGRTPFSRSADGLAVVRSSIREFLAAEAMYALGIPTTRSLSLISLPDTPVIREQVESACVLTRLAPSFIRIGSFEALNPPANMFFFGGGQQSGHWDALRILGEWVGRRVLNLPSVRWRGQEDGGDGEPWGKKLVMDVAERNAKMVAGWQAYGFMHGVINTDNVSILGLTIDYGPYAFMDMFDQYHICNHSDGEGRYAYYAQPSMILYALRSLLTTLAPLIGAEAELGKAVPPGWADDDTPEDKISKWRTKGMEFKDEMEALFQEVCSVEYGKLMHKRLALCRIDKDDESKFARPLLDLMSRHHLDFHSTFRRLSFFKPVMAKPENTNTLEEYITSLLELTPEPERLERERAFDEWRDWLRAYAHRIENEREEWIRDSTTATTADSDGGDSSEGDDITARIDAEREKAALAANPRFVLRQWVLEEVIKAVEQDPKSGKRILRKVLHMACNPFDPWGAEGADDSGACLDDETREERRYCGLGDKRMLGFQCSCSS